jgi:hypothetical protein
MRASAGTPLARLRSGRALSWVSSNFVSSRADRGGCDQPAAADHCADDVGDATGGGPRHDELDGATRGGRARGGDWPMTLPSGRATGRADRRFSPALGRCDRVLLFHAGELRRRRLPTALDNAARPSPP